MSARRFGFGLVTLLVCAVACGRTSLEGEALFEDDNVAGNGGGAGQGGPSNGSAGISSGGNKAGDSGSGTGGSVGSGGRGGSIGGTGGAGGGPVPDGGVGGRGGTAGGSGGLDGGIGGGAGGAGTLVIRPIGPSLPVNSQHPYQAYVQIGSTFEDVTPRSSWTVNDQAIAIISNSPGQQGLLSALRAGDTRVSATFGSLSASVPVNVTNAKISSLMFVFPPSVLRPGGIYSYRVLATYTDSRPPTDVTQNAFWSSTDPKVATVSNDPTRRGSVTAVSVGKTVITASFAGLQAGSPLVVESPPTLVSISITPSEANGNVDGDVQFTALGTTSDGKTMDITLNASWSTSTGVATISGGRARCRTAGTVTVTASYMGRSAPATLRCSVANLIGVRVVPSMVTDLPVGQSVNLQCVAILADMTERYVNAQSTWMSDNAMVASVNSSGMMRAISPGSATIVCSYGGMTGKAAITVK